MPFYFGDYLKDTMKLSAERHGIYLLLIINYWQDGPLSCDLDELSIVARVPADSKSLKYILDNFFSQGSDKYYHKRIDQEILNAQSRREASRKNGKKGGRPRGSTTKNISDWSEMVAFFQNSCVCCGAQFGEGDTPTRDHILPQALGGGDEIENLQPLCRECNSSKGADHDTDYRLRYIETIPEYLATKWFQNNPGITQGKANHNPQKSSSPSQSHSSIPTESKTEKRETRKRFTPPTIEEITEYCQEKGVDPNKWHDHYSSNGWKVGRNKMTDWKAAVRTWSRNEFNGKDAQKSPTGGEVNFVF